MGKFKLSQELASTIQHVRLNENGWWKKTIQRFILIFIAFKNEFLLRKEITNNLNKEYFDFSIDNIEIEKQIDTLIKSKNL